MIIQAKIKTFRADVKGEGEDSTVTGQLVLTLEGLDGWQVELLSSVMDGMNHEVTIDEHVALKRGIAKPAE